MKEKNGKNMDTNKKCFNISPYAEFHIRLQRGQALTYEIKGALTLAMALKILFDITLLWTTIFTALAFVIFYILGYIDLKYIKLFQKEAELGTGKYNPHLVRNLKR